jgi:hypothetical protein
MFDSGRTDETLICVQSASYFGDDQADLLRVFRTAKPVNLTCAKDADKIQEHIVFQGTINLRLHLLSGFPDQGPTHSAVSLAKV